MINEDELRIRICQNCHVAIMQPHADIKLAAVGWYKCPICAYCKQIDLKVIRGKQST